MQPLVAPHAGAWIEMAMRRCAKKWRKVAPHAGEWIEMRNRAHALMYAWSRPTRVRGLK